MARDIDELLGSFAADDYTVRLCRGVCAVVPFAPELPHYHSLAEALKQASAEAKQPTLDRAKVLVAEDGPQRALWVANAIDTADSGISVFSGVRSAVNLYRSKEGERLEALETDEQQAADAVLKALAIAYLVWKLFPGSPTEKVAAFRALPSGQALAFTYAALDLGLPFADNALTGGGQLLHSLWQRFGPQQVEKLAAVAGPEGAQGAATVMEQLLGPLDTLVQSTSGHLSGIADAVTGYLPSAMNVGDKAAGVVATAADAMPIYRYLGSRVVAEACIAQALKDAPAAAAVNPSNPAMDQVVYTTKKAGKDEIAVPNPPKRRGFCLFFAVLIASTGLAGVGGAIAALFAVVAP